MHPAGTEAPALGKITPGFFARVIAPRLGAARPEVLVGPRAGHDAAIVKVGAGRVLAVTTDPLSVIPVLGPERSARLACHLVASDLWTTGIPPAYASIDLNLPPRFTDDELERYWAAMSETWATLGVAVVTGHTGRYEGCEPSIVGAATLIGIGDEGRYVSPAMAAPGDRVIVTKGCAIETAAVAAALCPRRLAARLAPDALARLAALEAQVSVVADCRAALGVGVRERGVTALHDATEGGVLGGLVELAHACGHDLRIERARIPLADEVRIACDVLGVDPYVSLSEGALLVCAAPRNAPAVLGALADAGIAAAEIGEVMKGSGRVWIAEPGGAVTTLDQPPADPYWAAYERAVREGWE
ncbi:MAG TPA: AIR synthase-related protein [Candidatus Acidoferrales bacterium]|nr:AIR synthase-related protein [Candidatus Acidoferrales bacterium]